MRKTRRHYSNKRTAYKIEVFFIEAEKAIQADCSVFHEPQGNDKTKGIPCFNLLPGVTCSPEACKTCLIHGCYAVKNGFRPGYNIETNTTLKAWTDNTVLAKRHVKKLEKLIDAWLTENKPLFFRWHSSGDFTSVEYARMVRRLALKHPETRFLAFTKQFNIVRHVLFYKISNFELVLSAWPGCSIPEDLRKHYRIAWCQDGTETRIPANSIECPGNCENCRACWNLSTIGRDSFFRKH